MDIVYLPPTDLEPYPANAKVHTQEQITELKKLITKFGFDQPIVVDKNYVIIKGHGRRQASIELGLKTVPVLVAHHLSPEQVKLARLVDNDVVSSDWDITMLKNDLDILVESGGSLDMACVSNDYFEELMEATGHTNSIEISDHIIGTLKVKHVCPKCEYRF